MIGVKNVIAELRPEVRALLKKPEASKGKKQIPALDDKERSILERLNKIERALDLDEFLDGLALTVDRALTALCRLEVKGVIWSLLGGFFQKKDGEV